MEPIGRQVALLLFTDGLTMPAPAIEFVRRLCDSESASLLSAFAVATLTLGVCLHSRETIESAKQFLDAVDSLGDRLSTMMGDGEEESGVFIGSAIVDNSVLQADELCGRPGVGINNDAIMFVGSSDKANSTLREEKLPEAASHPSSIDQKLCAVAKGEARETAHATRDPQSPARVESCGSKQAVMSPLRGSNTQLLGDTESPTGISGAPDCSEAASGPDNAFVLPLISSSRPSMSEKLNCKAGAIVNPITSTPNNMLSQAVIDIVDEAAAIDLDKTIVSSHSLLIFQGTECTPGEDENLANVETSVRTSTGQRVDDDFGEDHLELSSSSYESLASSDNGTNACNELVSAHMADQHTESKPEVDFRDTSSEPTTHLSYSTVEDDATNCTAPSASIEMEADSSLDATKQPEGFCEATREVRKTSVVPWNFASPLAPIKIAENMRRRAFDLMEESHKLRESSLCVIFEYMNPSYDVRSVSGLAMLDLHNLMVQEAIIITRLHLDFCRKIGTTRTDIITGRGRHSKGGEAVLRPAVFKELARHPDIHICDTDPNPGRFVLTLARDGAAKAGE